MATNSFFEKSRFNRLSWSLRTVFSEKRAAFAAMFRNPQPPSRWIMQERGTREPVILQSFLTSLIVGEIVLFVCVRLNNFICFSYRIYRCALLYCLSFLLRILFLLLYTIILYYNYIIVYYFYYFLIILLYIIVIL